jgi:N-acetylmuramic acid 6-phosphate etherase
LRLEPAHKPARSCTSHPRSVLATSLRPQERAWSAAIIADVKVSAEKLKRTEQRNPRSRGLDQMTTRELVRAINREDATVACAVGRELAAIARAVDAITSALGSGGRLIYAGAGTSGRLAVLDAAECPPTFGVPPRLIQAVIAGGRRALTGAVEGAEDSASQGARDIASKRITAHDIVVGISASGSTPYVLGALRLARDRGAATVAVTANRNSPATRIAGIAIAPDTGPEIIAGSTRMKAGTAQKLILNTLTTAAIVRLGRVYNNWMIDVALTNEKLRKRGLRILQEAAGASSSQAKRALDQAGNARVALVMLKAGVSVIEARRQLQQAGGNLRRALGEVARQRTAAKKVRQDG